jgi:hypothetical protein
VRRGRPKIHFEKAESTNLLIPISIKKLATEASRKARLSLSQWVVEAVCKNLENQKKNIL